MIFNPRALREQAGLSQSELGQIIGIRQPTISKIELGYREPTLSEAERWIHACGYQIELHRVDAPVLPDDDRRRLDRLIAALPAMGPSERTTLDVLLAAWTRPPL